MNKVRIISMLIKLIELAKKNSRCMEEISKIRGKKTFFIRARDTDERCYFTVEDGEINGPFEGTPADFDIRIEANHKTLLNIWSGKLDPDAAWLSRKIDIKGSFFDIVKLKNLFEVIS